MVINRNNKSNNEFFPADQFPLGRKLMKIRARAGSSKRTRTTTNVHP